MDGVLMVMVERGTRWPSRQWATWLLAAMLIAGDVHAAVVVLANRAEAPLTLTVLAVGQPPRTMSLAPGDARPLFSDAAVRLRGARDSLSPGVPLEASCAYDVADDPTTGALVVKKIPLGETAGQPWPAPGGRNLLDGGIIAVKIFVDDDEVRPRRVWEPAIRERIDQASAVLAEHCGVRLRVAAVETWDSDDQQTDFAQSLSEFERETRSEAATVAIGFSSQYLIASGRVHMGGTRGTLHSHILLKERARNVLDTERLELLVHELGHFLGASHSAEPTSVMRPVIGDGRQRAAGARLQFDPPNTLLMALVGQEMRQRRIEKLSDLSPETRRRMREIYTSLGSELADDPAAENYLRRMATASVEPLIEDTRTIIQRIVRIAEAQQQLRQRPPAAGGPGAVEGDELLETYVRHAALAAKQVRPENGPRAMLLALGVAIDNGDALSKLPLTRVVVARLERPQERVARLAALGSPTMRGRADLAKHFFVSAHLTALAGSETARGAGLVKEMLDARGGTGFSFADMAANRAGIVFAGALLTGRLSLDDVAQGFAAESFLPPVGDLQEQLDAAALAETFGGLNDARLAAELARIEARVMALPAYQAATSPAP